MWNMRRVLMSAIPGILKNSKPAISSENTYRPFGASAFRFSSSTTRDNYTIQSFETNIDMSTAENKRRLFNRLAYRSKQRGFLELDLVLGKWVDQNIHSMDETAVRSLIHLLNLENLDLWRWLSGQEQPPEAISNNPVFTAVHKKVMGNLDSYASPEMREILTVEAGEGQDHMYRDVPQAPKSKSERKPYVTPMKILIQRAKVEKEARKAQPCRMLEERPDNGLLVPELVNIAHQVYRSREILLSGLSKLVKKIPVQRCRYCPEIHIGQTGHEIRTCMGRNSGSRDATHVWKRGGTHDVICFPNCFHLNDRVGKPRVGHDERNTVRRIPAILELCIQAGVDLDQYPTKRRTKPVYSIEGRIVDFEPVAEMEENERDLGINSTTTEDTVKNILQLDCDVLSQMQPEPVEEKSLRGLSIMTLKSWFEMISGAKMIMEKYKVHTCGYCPEVQVGPKGHKVRKCKASKHQTRNGLHAWQEATIDDIVGPKYVWHVPDLSGPPLVNNLKRFYGKAPAVVELCVHGGAPIPDEYRSMMRLDVVSPNRDEVDLVT